MSRSPAHLQRSPQPPPPNLTRHSPNQTREVGRFQERLRGRINPGRNWQRPARKALSSLGFPLPAFSRNWPFVWESGYGVTQMLRPCLLVLCFVFFLALRPLLAASMAARRARGLGAARRGDCADAVGDLEAFAAVSPHDIQVLTALGVCETRLGHPKRAADSFLQVIALEPRSWEAWSNLGANYLQLRRTAEAVNAFRRAAQLNPRSSLAWLNLGLALVELQKPQDAFRALNRAHRLSPENSEIERARHKVAQELMIEASNLIERKKYQEAENLLRAIALPLALPPRSRGSWNDLLGYAEFRLNQPRPALRHLQEAVHLEPDNEGYLLDLGQFLLHYRDYVEASRVFEAGLARFRNSSRLRLALAMTFELEGRHDQAIALLKNLIASNPDFELAYHILGISYENTRRWAEMVKLGKKLQRVNKFDSLSCYLVGVGSLGLADKDPRVLPEALSALTEYRRLNPKSSRAHFLLARAYEDQGDARMALKELEETLQLDPHFAEAHYALAILYRQRGKPDLAQKEMERFNKLKGMEEKKSRLVLTESGPK